MIALFFLAYKRNFSVCNKRDDTNEIKPNKKAIKTCLDRGLSTEVIKLRLVRVDLPNGVEVLITNMIKILLN
jgi:hypothetical protein